MTASEIISKYISFFEQRGHKRIANAPLVPLNDPTTLFTSSGMQPLVPYLLGETHPDGNRLVNVQNCFRAQDIDEVGDNRHTTFFRMLGNWSLGSYFKKDQLEWIFTFLVNHLGLDPQKIYVTVYASEGNQTFEDENGRKSRALVDTESIDIWKSLFSNLSITADYLDLKDIDINNSIATQQEIWNSRIFSYGSKKNWWSRSGTPDKMPAGEPGGPDSEIFYDFGKELQLHERSSFSKFLCHVNCDCGRFLEIGNSVFMQYKKASDGSLKTLPNKNVDFGGGLERLIMASEDNFDLFQTSLFKSIVPIIEDRTNSNYKDHKSEIRIIIDHLLGAIFMLNENIKPSKTEQGYILRRLIRRAYDNINILAGIEKMNLPTYQIIDSIINEYKDTDAQLLQNAENIKYQILEEANTYRSTLTQAQKILLKKYKQIGDEIMGSKEVSAEDAFNIYTTHGLSPTQIENLGFIFDKQAFAQKMEAHQSLSRKGAAQKFSGGLADHQERTVMGHTATHLLQQALRDVLGDHVYQTGSNITTERLRFDFSHQEKLTDEQIQKVETIVNEKIKANLPVYYLMMPLKKAKELGAIGLFDEKYQEQVKVYCMGSDPEHPEKAYSKEFCGGPHVDFTSKVKSFKITKQENIGNKQRRLYAVVG